MTHRDFDELEYPPIEGGNVPFDDARLLAMNNGVVELTAAVSAPERDARASFGDEVRQLLLDHQYQIMTDPAILAGDNLKVATVIESRDPLPEPLHDALATLGFSPLAPETGGDPPAPLLSRFQKRQRSRLDRWRTVYQRAADVSKRLALLEDHLIDEVPEGAWSEISARASHALIRGARTHLQLVLSPDRASLGRLEHALLEEWGGQRGHLVLHPAFVRSLAGFLAETFITEAPRTAWSPEPEDDGPLWVRFGHGLPIRTDPEFRVFLFVLRGPRASLDQYVNAVLAQSGAHPSGAH